MKWGNNRIWLYINWVFTGIIFVLGGCNTADEKEVSTQKPLPATIAKGKQLFQTRCASCHKVNQELTGPALNGAEARWPDKEKLYAFIRNSEEVIRQDKYARELWLQYNQTIMLAQPDLTDEDIRAVLDYINSAAEK
jgi:mono/diheme cytochrome c family protein